MKIRTRAPAARVSRVLLAFGTLVLMEAAACRREFSSQSADPQAVASASVVPAQPSAGCRAGTVRAALDAEQQSLVVGGQERAYLIDAPESAPDHPLPLVLDFHGLGGTGRQQRWWTGFGTLARRERFIAVHPDGREGVRIVGLRGRGWDWRPRETGDVAFVNALLDRLEREYCVDRRRVFATGMSNGGFFANLLGCRLADRFAAVAPVAGAMQLPGCVPSHPVAVLLLYGRADRLVKAEVVEGARSWWANVDGCGAPVTRDGCSHYAACRADVVYCEGSHAHTWPNDASALIWRFFQTHPRS